MWEQLQSYLPIVKQIADIWAGLTVSVAIGVACLLGAWFLPVARQLFIGLAVAAFISTFGIGWGAKQERDIWKARADQAEELRQARDRAQSELAQGDEARRQAGLDELNRKEDESYEDYKKRLEARKVPGCILTDDDLR